MSSTPASDLERRVSFSAKTESLRWALHGSYSEARVLDFPGLSETVRVVEFVGQPVPDR